jgi:hypothetical protein
MPEIDSLAGLVYSPIQVFPLAFDLDVCFGFCRNKEFRVYLPTGCMAASTTNLPDVVVIKMSNSLLRQTYLPAIRNFVHYTGL